MAELQGTVVTSPIVPGGDDGNRYPTHLEDWGQGGYRSVETVLDRNAIPTERRKAGMLVNVLDEGILYELLGDLKTWKTFSGGSGESSKWLVVPLEFVNLPDGASRADIDKTFPQTSTDPNYAFNYFSQVLTTDSLGFIAYSDNSRPSPTGTVYVYPFISFKVGASAENIMFVDLYRASSWGNPSVCNFWKVSGTLGFTRTPLGGNSWYRIPVTSISIENTDNSGEVLESWQANPGKSIISIEQVFSTKLSDNRIGGFFYNSLGDGDGKSIDYKFCLFLGSTYSVDKNEYTFSVLDLGTGKQHTWKKDVNNLYSKTVGESSISGLPSGGAPGQTLIAGETGKAAWTDRVLDLESLIYPSGGDKTGLSTEALGKLVKAYESGVSTGYISSKNIYCPISIHDFGGDKKLFMIQSSYIDNTGYSVQVLSNVGIDLKKSSTEVLCNSMIPITMSEYNALTEKGQNTLYIIKG